jgi:hypothetical protein
MNWHHWLEGFFFFYVYGAVLMGLSCTVAFVHSTRKERELFPVRSALRAALFCGLFWLPLTGMAAFLLYFRRTAGRRT